MTDSDILSLYIRASLSVALVLWVAVYERGRSCSPYDNAAGLAIGSLVVSLAVAAPPAFVGWLVLSSVCGGE